MVKTPRTRHTKRPRQPITIELDPSEVSAAEEPPKQPDDIDVSVSREPFEQQQAEPLVTEPVAAADVEEISAKTDNDAPADEIDRQASAESVNATEVDEPIEDRIEAEKAATGAERAAYSFDSSEREQAEAKKPEQTIVPPPIPPRRSGFSSLSAGLIGAVATLAGVMALQWGGIFPTPNPGYTGPSLEPVQTELSTIKSELAALKSAPAPDSGLAASVDQLKGELATLQSAIQSGAGGDAAAVAALDAKLKDIEARIGAPAPDVSEKITGLEGQVAAATDAVTKGDGRLAALEQTIAGLTSKVDQQASQPKVALAIAATALKSAVDRGGPFSAELETLAAIAPNAAELAPLRVQAENGIATAADLESSFAPAADAMIAAAEPVNPNAGIVDRLLNSAKSMVKVRPVGEVAGDDVGARVARMEVAVKAGQYDAAIAEYDGLPDAAKAAGAAYADRLKARLEVTKLVDQLVAGAMKAA